MNAAHRKALEEEFALATLLLRQRKDEEAFAHLQRAHVLGRGPLVTLEQLEQLGHGHRPTRGKQDRFDCVGERIRVH